MAANERGIVVSTPIVAKRRIFQLDAVPLDAHELRYWLLFWDKLNFPLFDGFHIDPGDDGAFLESAGVLQRHRITNYTISMGDPERDKPEEQFQYHFLKAYRDLEAAEPGTWSLATGPRSITFDDDMLDDGRGVLVRLHRALPVPDKDVPLAEVLEFKEKRRDEMLALRCHLEAAYLRIMSAPDGPLAINSELTAVDVSLADFLNATKGGAIKRWISTSIDAELQILPGINTAVTAFASGLPLLQSLLSGAAVTISVSATSGLKGLRRETGVPWRYVARYLDEVFPSR